MTTTFAHWIDGAATTPDGGQFLTSYDPVTAEPWSEIARGNAADVDAAVASAKRAFTEWRRTPPSVRAEHLWRLADLVAESAEELAQLETKDIGKVIREMRGQMTGLPRWWRHAAGLCHQLQGETIPHDKASILNYTIREPYGVIGVMTPFNSPVLLTTFAIGPALAAGNTVVVKPSEHASSAVLKFAELVAEAGFPDGAMNVVTGLGDEVGDPLVGHPDVAKIVFTGGLETARRVAARAAQRVKPMVLELGGKSANIVFGDADIDSAVNGIMAGIFAAAGQTCVAGSRVLVHRDAVADVSDALVSRARTIVMGDPRADATEIGPMAVERIRDALHDRVTEAVGSGATVRVGGEVAFPEGMNGWFYTPTVIEGVGNDHPVAQQELFGPVVVVLPFDDEDEAVSIANDTPYGLAAGLWTQDIGRAHRMAAEINAGTVWVNTYRSLSYVSPFGGRGLSGYGKELGIDGLREFTNSKSVWVETSGEKIGDPFVLR